MTNHLDLAERAAQAVRELNHRIRGAGLHRAGRALPARRRTRPPRRGPAATAEPTPELAARRTRRRPPPVRQPRRRQPNRRRRNRPPGRAGDAAHDLAHVLAGAQQYLAHLGATEPRSRNEDRTRRVKDLADLAAGLKPVGGTTPADQPPGPTTSSTTTATGASPAATTHPPHSPTASHPSNPRRKDHELESATPMALTGRPRASHRAAGRPATQPVVPRACPRAARPSRVRPPAGRDPPGTADRTTNHGGQISPAAGQVFERC